MKLRSFIIGTAIASIFWVILPVILIRVNGMLGLPVFRSTLLRTIGIVVTIPGIAVVIQTVYKHLATGRVTPVAVEPPKKFIVNGLYRFTRNPMYLAILTTFFGGFLFFGHFLLFVYFLLGIPAIHLFIVFREEPELRRIFGEEYEHYCRNVPRWILK